MIDLKKTLNLPSTKFPMKANLPVKELEIQKEWKETNIYNEMQTYRKDSPLFILHDGPPYANGNIHIGHAVNKILKDIILKSKFLSGFKTPYIPGWDCHGLPIELEVEKNISKKDEISDEEFRKLCREYAYKQVEKQKEDFIRLGVLGNWDNPYLTSSPELEAEIINSLKKIYEKGHISRGVKPVYWCPVCKSALAEAEVEYHEKESTSIDVKFEITDELNFLNTEDKKVSIVIWTTTPWTLPSNQAIAINENIDYVLIERNKELLIICNELFEKFNLRSGENCKLIKRFEGKKLINIKVKHPLFKNKIVSILHGDFVTTDTGTGCVHIAPAHGVDDFELGKKYDLEILNPVTSSGLYVGEIEEIKNIHVFKIDQNIIDILERESALIGKEKFRHSYPHNWRTKTPLIFRTTPQWFISMSKNNLRKNALQELPKVNWIPDWGYNRIKTMIDDRPDWCISRQRKWGVPITLLINKKTQELHPNTSKIFNTVYEEVKKDGIEAWFKKDIKDLIDDHNDYEKVNDTLDVWFDSGATHSAVLKEKHGLDFPADLYLEGSDQHRGWFQSSFLSSVSISGKPPFKSAMTHGFTVDAKGNKMSKSKGNVVSPQKVINRLGADILRLWVASTDYTSEISVSDEILNRTSDKYRKIRNTIRFLLANISDFEEKDYESEISNELDKWILCRAINTQKNIIENYDKYNMHNVVQIIHSFCVNELGSFYLDIIKDRIYTINKNSYSRKSAQQAMKHILNMLILWLAPICPHTAEESWSHFTNTNNNSVLLNNWYDTNEIKFGNRKVNDEDWERILNIKKIVTKEIELKREQGVIGSSLEAKLDINCTNHDFLLLEKFENEVKFLFIVSEISLSNNNELESTEITISKTKNKKCERCWHYVENYSSNPLYNNICSRCVENIETDGEIREYA